jgi:hypothetical protein
MATIKAIKADINQYGKPQIHLEAVYHGGRFVFPIDIEDHGSVAANEKAAAISLRLFLAEIEEPLRRLSGN